MKGAHQPVSGSMNTLLNSINRDLAAGTAADLPEWVHLIPAGTFTGADGRGPYQAGDIAQLIANSIQPGRKLPIDVNHAIDHLGASGHASPAVAWIVALEGRGDGVWGKVEWTDEGQRLVQGRSYGFLSPVFTATKAAPHRLVQLLRASLTNDPNLTLTALHTKQKDDIQMEEELRKALGLPEAADQAAILAAVTKVANASTGLVTIAKAAGAAETATADEIVAALQARGSGDDAAELRSQVKELNTRLTAAVTEAATTRAQTAIDKAIEDGRIVPALRDRFIARHIKEPAEVEAEIKLMPSIHAGGLGKRRVIEAGDKELTDSDAVVCEQMGLDPKAFAKAAAEIQKELH